MRNFRKAALAGATAVALAFGSASVATAAEAPKQDTGSSADANTGSSNEQQGSGDNTNAGSSEDKGTEASLSSKIGNSLGAVDKDGNPTGVDGRDLFGSSKENWDEVPSWAKLFYVTTIFTSVSAIVGLIVGPAYNFFVHGPFAA